MRPDRSNYLEALGIPDFLYSSVGSEAIKTANLIKQQSRVVNRNIPHSVLFTRKSAMATSRTYKFYYKQVEDAGIDILAAPLTDRDAYKAIKSFECTLNGLDPKDVYGLNTAIKEAETFTENVKVALKNALAVGEG